MFNSYFDSLTIIKILTLSDILFLTILIIIMIISGSYITIKTNNNFIFSKMYSVIAIYGFILFILLYLNFVNKTFNYIDNLFIFSNYNIDNIVNSFSKILLLFSLIFLLIMYTYISNKRLQTTFEYPIIILIAILAMISLLRFNDLFIWFLTIEMQSFCFYTLAAYRTNRSYLQTESGLKYFLFGSIASSLYLFGISILYLYTGSLNIDNITVISYFPTNDAIIGNIGIILILISIFFKLGIAPFHFWVPLVYTYSSSIVTYLFILLPKIPLFYLLYKFSFISISYVLYIPILLSLFIGTIFAFNTTNLKTFFAYSAIANTAFFLAPLIYQSYYSFITFILYLFTYNILITIAFLPLLFLIRADNTIAFINLRDIIILKKINPLLAIFYGLMALSFAGIPPLMGFFSKLFIILSALSFSAYLITFLLLAFSFLSGYYYIRLVVMLFFSFYLKLLLIFFFFTIKYCQEFINF